MSVEKRRDRSEALGRWCKAPTGSPCQEHWIEKGGVVESTCKTGIIESPNSVTSSVIN